MASAAFAAAHLTEHHFSPIVRGSQKISTGYASGSGGREKALAVASINIQKNSSVAKLNVRLATVHKKSTLEDVLMKNQENDSFRLTHTTWRCQYHIIKGKSTMSYSSGMLA